MIGEVAICGRTGCELQFVKTTHNMKFHSSECCRIQTNADIMERYHEKAAIRRGKKRLCMACQISVLSRYNDNKMCAACELKSKRVHRGEAAMLVGSVVWT